MQRRLFLLILIILSSQLSFAQIDDEVIDNEPVIENNKKNEKLKKRKNTFKVDNFFFGTTFSFMFGNFLFIDISPYGGYL